MQVKKRLAGPDIIRSIAILLVMGVHSFAFSGQMELNVRSLQWTAWTVVFFFVKVCVPLFLLLTGYLQCKHGLNRRHYTGIIPVLVSYVVILIPLLILKNIVQPSDNLWREVLYLFDFQAGYSWYVEIYLCLFLIIPFLNILLSHLTQKQKKILLATTILLTMVPAVFKSFVIAGTIFTPIPDYMEAVYFITYYLIGAYIAEYRPSPKRRHCLCVLGGTLLIETSIYYLLAYNENRWLIFNNNASLPHMINAVALFLLFYQVERVPTRFLSWLVQDVARCSFEMYLISYLMDQAVYHFIPAPWGLPLVFLSSYLTAKLLRLGLVPLSRLLRQKAEQRSRTHIPAA